MRCESVAGASPPQGEARGPEPALFDFKGHQLRTVTIDGEPWFAAKDVCLILFPPASVKAKGVFQFLTTLKSEERQLVNKHTHNLAMGIHGGRPDITVISESGLYRLIMKSVMPAARPFQDWVTRDVLPAIRKTGSYVLGEEKLELPPLFPQPGP